MATNSRTFEVRFVGDTKGLTNSFKDIQKQAGMLGKSVSTASMVMRSALAGISVAAVTRGIQSTVMAASNLSESIAKANTVFKSNQDAIEAWSKTTSKAFGVNRQAALEAAGTYGNLFQAFGVSEQKAYDMSTSLVELAADMASFNNVPIDQALTALRSGLSGEAEPLKRFGVGLTEARLKAEAAAIGLGNFTGTLPPAIRMQAAYSLVLKDTALQQGDVARTSGGLANQMKFLQAGVADAKASLGELFIPVVLNVVNVLNDSLIPVIQDAIEALKMDGIGAGFEVFMQAIDDAVSGLTGTAKAIYDVVTALVALKVAFYFVNTMPTLIGLASKSFMFLKGTIDSVRIATMYGTAGFKVFFTSIKAGLISTGIGALAVILGLIVQALIDAYLTSETFRAKVNAAFSSVIDTVKTLFGWLKSVLQAIGLFSEATPYIDAAALSATRASDKLTDVKKSTLELGKASAVVKKPIQDLAGSLSGGGAGGKSAVDAAAEAAKKAIDAFQNSLDVAKNKLSDAQNAFKNFASQVSGSISGVINFGDAANAETGSFLENLIGQAAKASEFGNKVQDLLRLGLSERAISQVLSAGADAGIKIANEIIAGGMTIVNQVNDLVAATQTLADQVGESGAKLFYEAGVTQGQALVDGIIAAIKAAGFIIDETGKITSPVANVPVAAPTQAPSAVVKKPTTPAAAAPPKLTAAQNAALKKLAKIPAMATGGIVTKPTLAMIGEAGTEAVIPLSQLGAMNGGAIYNVTVNAGIGTDGAAVGREIVDAIKRFERTSGPVFASA